MAVVHREGVVQRMVQNTRKILSRFSRERDLGRPLLTGGHCSEVVVSTGLTVIPLIFKKYIFKLSKICQHLSIRSTAIR